MDEPQPPIYDPYAPTPPASYPSYPQAPEPARRRHPRLVAAGTAVAVLAAASGAGFALGRIHHGSSPSAGQFSGQVPPSFQGGNLPPGLTPYGGPGSQSGGSATDSSATPGTPASATQLSGLVRVATTLGYQNGRAAGTGMVLTSSGEVITNNHVVEGATKIRVKLMSTGQSYAAKVVGTDVKDDVAVLQLKNASGLPTVTTATTAAGVGDAVTAVGDAGGSTSTFRAATGSVAALGRSISTRNQDGSAGERLKGMIKISSDVISGDSGGATYDANGQVVGMTTAASTGTSNVVGFAIPISKVLRIAGDLESGVVQARYTYGNPAFVGIALGRTGTTVVGVYPGTPAAKAGIGAGDAITAVDGTRVHTSSALRSAIHAHQPGDTVTLTWTDPSGATHTGQVTLIAGPVA